MNKKILIPILAVSLIAMLAGAGYVYWNKKSKIAAPQPQSNDPEKTSVAEDKIADDATRGVLPAIQINPLKDKPDLNPVDKTNPYKNIKTNPFK